jgi:hypothetical protein
MKYEIAKFSPVITILMSSEVWALAAFGGGAVVLHLTARIRVYNAQRRKRPIVLKPLGKSGLAVSAVGQGGAALGEIGSTLDGVYDLPWASNPYPLLLLLAQIAHSLTLRPARAFQTARRARHFPPRTRRA